MRMLKLLLAALSLSIQAVAKDVEQVSVVENEISTISVPFGIKAYTPSNKEVVRIEKISDSTLRVTGRRRGRCDLEVRGDRGLVQKYEISVLGDLAAVLETLTMELDSIQEIRAQIIGERIRIDGEVSSIRKWEYLTKVLAGYPGVRNFATFYPGPDVLLKMKATLQQSGFKVVFQQFDGDSEKWPIDTVALSLNKQTRIMSVQARVFLPEKGSKIMRCLSSEKWLSMDISASSKKSDDGDIADFQIRCMPDIHIDNPTIRLSVAYLAIGEGDARTLGGNGVPEVQGVFSHLQNLVRGGSGQSAATIGANLDTTIKFLADSGVSRMSQKGYTLLRSWDSDGAKFKSGGVLNVRVSGSENGDLKAIPYGFNVNVKGGLRDEKHADLDLDVSISRVSVVGSGDIDQKSDETKQKIVCTLGKTTVLGGFGNMIDEQTLSGLPILRHTPMLNWFVSETGKSLSDRKLLIMICPELNESSMDGTLDVESEIQLPTLDGSSKTTDERIEEKKPFSGFWYWLNWFTF